LRINNSIQGVQNIWIYERKRSLNLKGEKVLTCETREKTVNGNKLSLEQSEKDRLVSSTVDGSRILKHMFRKYDVKVRNGFFRRRPEKGSYGSAPSGSAKGGEYLDALSDIVTGTAMIHAGSCANHEYRNHFRAYVRYYMATNVTLFIHY
jgi:hypothetical protein